MNQILSVQMPNHNTNNSKGYKTKRFLFVREYSPNRRKVCELHLGMPHF